jgi:hypothetical protein
VNGKHSASLRTIYRTGRHSAQHGHFHPQRQPLDDVARSRRSRQARVAERHGPDSRVLGVRAETWVSQCRTLRWRQRRGEAIVTGDLENAGVDLSDPRLAWHWGAMRRHGDPPVAKTVAWSAARTLFEIQARVVTVRGGGRRGGIGADSVAARTGAPTLEAGEPESLVSAKLCTVARIEPRGGPEAVLGADNKGWDGLRGRVAGDLAHSAAGVRRCRQQQQHEQHDSRYHHHHEWKQPASA